MEIIKGKIKCAKKVVIYGPEGIGKSTFAAQFPDPLFCDTEGSTNELDVARFKKPTSWEILKNQIDYIKSNPDCCKTYAVDTIDWAEMLCIQSVCAKFDKKGIEDFGYGNGYVYVKEEFAKFLNSLEEIIAIGINVVLTAHAQIVKFEQPDELGSYDRWQLKLGKKTSSQTAPLVKEWADLLLFANYKTFSIATDDKGNKRKAQGGERCMYTTHHPCWDAKNRAGLADCIPFDYSQIAFYIEDNIKASTDTVKTNLDNIIEVDTPIVKTQQQPPQSQNENTYYRDLAKKLPQNLVDLMEQNQVLESQVQRAVADAGYFPDDTPIENYGLDFINGCLVGAWESVYKTIKAKFLDLPFE